MAPSLKHVCSPGGSARERLASRHLSAESWAVHAGWQDWREEIWALHSQTKLKGAEPKPEAQVQLS